MIILDATDKSVCAVLAGAVAANQPIFTVAYADTDGTTFIEAGGDGVLNSTTEVELIAAPAAGHRRIVKYVSIYNADTAAVTVSLYVRNGADLRIIKKKTLNVGASLEFGLTPTEPTSFAPSDILFSATDKLAGRSSVGAGAGEEIPCTPAGRALIGKTAFPGFSVNKDGTNQSIPSATWTKLTWNTEEWDTNNNFADNKFTPGITGRYYLSITGLFDLVPIGKRIALAVYKNGALLKYGMAGDGAVLTSLSTHMACIVEANGTTDYFEAFAYHDAAADLNCNGAISATYFQGHFLPTG